MDYSLAWRSEDLEVVVVLFTVVIAFICYHFISNSPKWHAYLEKRYGAERLPETRVIGQRFLGAFFLGVLPLITILFVLPQGIADYGTPFTHPAQTLMWSLGASVIIIAINLIDGRKPANLEVYPQIRLPEWSRSVFTFSALGWVAYLLSYEFLFRGYLLFACTRAFGVWPAIAINVVIYALVHFPKNFKETVAAVPFGIIICAITFWTGNFWTAFWVHVVLALGSEWVALYFHPEIHVKR